MAIQERDIVDFIIGLTASEARRAVAEQTKPAASCTSSGHGQTGRDTHPTIAQPQAKPKPRHIGRFGTF